LSEGEMLGRRAAGARVGYVMTVIEAATVCSPKNIGTLRQ
jgi:hypothetical protein